MILFVKISNDLATRSQHKWLFSLFLFSFHRFVMLALKMYRLHYAYDMPITCILHFKSTLCISFLSSQICCLFFFGGPESKSMLRINVIIRSINTIKIKQKTNTKHCRHRNANNLQDFVITSVLYSSKCK